MAVAHCEFPTDELEAVLDAVKAHRPRSKPLERAQRELQRRLSHTRETERRERAHVARMRAERRVPDFDEEPLTPHTMMRPDQRRAS